MKKRLLFALLVTTLTMVIPVYADVIVVEEAQGEELIEVETDNESIVEDYTGAGNEIGVNELADMSDTGEVVDSDIGRKFVDVTNQTDMESTKDTLDSEDNLLGVSQPVEGTAKSSGTCGTNVNYTIYDTNNDDVGDYAYIYGSGDMDSYSYNNQGPFRRNRYINTVVVDTGVTSIGEDAFGYCYGITEVRISDTVTSIGTNTFQYCTALETIDIPNNVTSIGDAAFNGCDKLKTVTLPSGLTAISNNLFRGCALEAITIPSSIESIGQYAFYSCKFTSVEIPASVTSISSEAFVACGNLSSVTMHEGLESIGSRAFLNCNNLKSIYIPKSVKSIASNAIGMVQNSGSIVAISDFVIYGVGGSKAQIYAGLNGISFIDVSLPEGTVVVKSGKCGSNVYFTVYDTVVDSETKGDTLHISGTGKMTGYFSSPFSDYSDTLKTVVIQPGVTNIGSYMFSGCKRINSVTIPEGVTSIDNNAFDSCSRLEEIVLPSGVTSIGNGAFRLCIRLKGITLGQGLLSIGEEAFYSTVVEAIDIPDSVTSIGAKAFHSCSTLEELTIPDSLTSIGDYAFENCSGITTIVLPGGVTSMGVGLFSGCMGLEEVTLPSGMTSVGKGMFSSCRKLKEIDLPANITNIGQEAFKDCSTLKEIVLPSGVTSIGTEAFSQCTSLEKINIPDGVNVINNKAFYGCLALKVLTLPDEVTGIGEYAFYGCSSLSMLVIPEGLESIGLRAIENCGLTSIRIPESVTGIADYAVGFTYESGTRTKIDDFVIYGIKDTAAHEYAIKNGFTFIEKEYVGKIVKSGKCGETAVYTLYDTDNDDVGDYLEISGTGDMYDYDDTDRAPWRSTTSYNTNGIKEVVIGEGITSVGAYAFEYCTGVKDITLPDGIKSIGAYAFASTNPTEIEIPKSIESIGHYALANCYNLTVKIMGQTRCEFNRKVNVDYDWLGYYGEPVISELGEGHTNYTCTPYMPGGTQLQNAKEYKCDDCGASFYFYYKPDENSCSILGGGISNGTAELIIPETIDDYTVTGISYQAFNNDMNIASVKIPSTVTAIGDEVFANCYSLVNVEIPDSVTTIGALAFDGCYMLNSIHIPASVTKIGFNAVGMTNSSSWNEYRSRTGFTIYGVAGSAAEEYANANGITFVEEGLDGYRITYMLDGGVNNPDNPDSYKTGDEIALKAPTKQGYVFEGWYSDSTYTNSVTGIEPESTGKVVLYAKWRLLYKLLGYKLTLNGNCDLQYIMELSDEVKNDTTSYVRFRVGDNAEGMVIEATPVKNGGNYYVYVCEVPAKNMADTISGALIYNGNEYSIEDYSVKEYLDSIIANEDNSADYALAENLAKAVLNYGGYAQKYFGYNTNSLANAGLTSDPVEGISDDYINDNVPETFDGVKDNSDFTYKGASLTLNSDTDLNIYFTNKNKYDMTSIANKYNAYVSGAEKNRTSLTLKDGLVEMSLKDIPAAELDDIYTFYLKNGSDNIAIEYSPMDYVRKAMNQDDVDLKNLCKALYLYNQEADKYFGAYTMVQ